MQKIKKIDEQQVALVIEWEDGFRSLFHYIWLRDNCRCRLCGDPVVGRRKLKLTSIDLQTSLISSQMIENGIHVVWNDEHASSFSSSWLREHAYDTITRKQQKFKPQLWDDDFRRKPSQLDFQTVLDNDFQLFEMLETVRDYGLCFLTNAPLDEGVIKSLAKRIGPIQESNFGSIQNLIIDNTQRSIANSTEPLKTHTDEPYRASPPGILMFHCIETDIKGAGVSVFLDGFEAAYTLRSDDPAGFKTLCNYPLKFRRYFTEDVDLISEFPVISVDEFGDVTGVRINDRVAAPLNIEPDAVPTYYRAWQKLLSYCEDSGRTLERNLSPGDIAIFDNHRILHGRTKLTLQGRRWLQWLQVERGDFYSTIRILGDRLNQSQDANPMLRGAYGSVNISNII